MPADVNVCIYALVPLFLNLWVSVRSICMPREEKPAAVFHGFQQDLEVARFFFFFFPSLLQSHSMLFRLSWRLMTMPQILI